MSEESITHHLLRQATLPTGQTRYKLWAIQPKGTTAASARHLMRSPITLILSGSEYADYCVAQHYSSLNYPTGGFTGSVNMTGVATSGATMRSFYTGEATTITSDQHWRSVSSDTPFIFYQGNYSTSSSNPSLYSESYLQLIATKFVLPEAYYGQKIQSMSLQMTYGGTIIAQGNSTSSNTCKFAANDTASSTGNWGAQGWVQKAGFVSSVESYTMPYKTIYPNLTDTITLPTHEAIGTPYGGIKVWASATADGYVKISTTPYTRTVSLSDEAISYIYNNHQGFLVLMPPVSTTASSTTSDSSIFNYYPVNRASYWLSCSYWGMKLIIEL